MAPPPQPPHDYFWHKRYRVESYADPGGSYRHERFYEFPSTPPGAWEVPRNYGYPPEHAPSYGPLPYSYAPREPFMHSPWYVPPQFQGPSTDLETVPAPPPGWRAPVPPPPLGLPGAEHTRPEFSGWVFDPWAAEHGAPSRDLDWERRARGDGGEPPVGALPPASAPPKDEGRQLDSRAQESDTDLVGQQAP